MAMIDPKDGKKFERDPEEGNIPTGLYLCELSRVQETGPSAKFPGGNNRLVFEFTVIDPNFPKLQGKKAVAFLGKTLLKTKEGKESNLVKWARMMGIHEPEKGFDPDTLLNKRFNVMIELTPGTNGEPSRGWARSVIAASNPTPTAPASNSWVGHHASNPSARWDYSDGTNVLGNLTSDQVRNAIAESGKTHDQVRLKPAGSPKEQAKTAAEWGFAAAVPTSLGSPVPF